MCSYIKYRHVWIRTKLIGSSQCSLCAPHTCDPNACHCSGVPPKTIFFLTFPCLVATATGTCVLQRDSVCSNVLQYRVMTWHLKFRQGYPEAKKMETHGNTVTIIHAHTIIVTLMMCTCAHARQKGTMRERFIYVRSRAKQEDAYNTWRFPSSLQRF